MSSAAEGSQPYDDEASASLARVSVLVGEGDSNQEGEQ